MNLKIKSKKNLTQIMSHAHTPKVKAEPAPACKISVEEELAIRQQPTADFFEPQVASSEFLALKTACNKVDGRTSTESFIKIKKMYSYLLYKSSESNNLAKCLQEIEQLADELTKTNYYPKTRVGNILYGKLLKTYTEQNNCPKIIEIADKSIPWFEKNADYFHHRSRISSKSSAYEKLNDKKNHYNFLKEEYKLLKFIINNYELACENFQTLGKPPVSVENLHREFSIVCSKLAEMTAHKKRNKAIQYLLDWKKSVSEADSFSTEIIKNRLRNIKKSTSNNKLQKTTLSEIKGRNLSIVRRGDKLDMSTPTSLSSFDRTSAIYEARMKK